MGFPYVIMVSGDMLVRGGSRRSSSGRSVFWGNVKQADEIWSLVAPEGPSDGERTLRTKGLETAVQR